MSPCPPREELQRLLNGAAGPEAEALETHVEGCPTCQQALEELTAGKVLAEQLTLSYAGPCADPAATSAEGRDFLFRLENNPPASVATLAGIAAKAPGNWPEVPGYEILEELGRGGMGVVYLATQRGLNRLVAIKMIGPEYAGSSRALDRFRLEAEAIARLQHPHVVAVLAWGEHEGVPYFALEFCPGGSLHRKVRGRPQPPVEAARLVATLARAVHAAHEAGIVHRDLKPANVLLTTDGTPKITDFGLAKFLGTDSGRTCSGALLGTPSYMAPEQARGEGVGPAADVWALGAILYEALTGRPPFHGPTVLETLDQVRTQDPVPPSRLQPKTPRDLDTITLKCLQKQAGSRYGSARELADDLDRFLAGEPIRARPARGWEHLVKWARRRPAVATLTATSLLAAVVGVAALAGMWWQAERARQAEAGRADAEAHRRRDTRRQLYFQSVALADREWQANRVAAARELLAACPDDLRGWEWRYLRRLCRSWDLELDGDGCVAFSPGGRTLATAAADRVKVHDAVTGKQFLTLGGHGGRIVAVAFSPDGRTLAAAGTDASVRLWHLDSGREVRAFAGLADVPGGLAFHADGRLLAAGSGRAVLVWETATGQLTRTLEAEVGELTGLAFGPGGLLAAAGADGSVQWWETNAARPDRGAGGHRGRGTSAAFSADGRWLAAGSDDGAIRLWDTATGREVRTLWVNSGRVAAVAFGAGTLLASAGGDGLSAGEVRLWDAGAGRALGMLRGHDRTVLGLAFAPGGRRLASVDDRSVKVWDLDRADGSRLLRGHKGGVTAVAFSEDNRLASTGSDGTLRLWEPTTGRQTECMEAHPRGATGVCFSPRGDRIASAGVDKVVKVWQASDGQEMAALVGHQAALSCVAFSPDGARLASAGWDLLHPGELKVWDVARGREALSVEGSPGKVAGLAFGDDGRLLAAACDDATVKVWDTETGRLAGVLRGHTTPVACVAFSADGRLLASGGGGVGQGEIKLWDVREGREVRSLSGHGGRVTGVAFSPDSRRLVSGGWDRTLRLWDPDDGRTILLLAGHADRVAAVAFSSDGRLVASGGWDGAIRVWDASEDPDLP